MADMKRKETSRDCANDCKAYRQLAFEYGGEEVVRIQIRVKKDIGKVDAKFFVGERPSRDEDCCGQLTFTAWQWVSSATWWRRGASGTKLWWRRWMMRTKRSHFPLDKTPAMCYNDQSNGRCALNLRGDAMQGWVEYIKNGHGEEQVFRGEQCENIINKQVGYWLCEDKSGATYPNRMAAINGGCPDFEAWMRGEVSFGEEYKSRPIMEGLR